MMAIGFVLIAFGFAVYAWYTGGGNSPAGLQMAGAISFVTGYWLSVFSLAVLLWNHAP